MKYFFLILLVGFSRQINAQKGTISTHKGAFASMEVILIVNDKTIKDTAVSYPFMRKFADKIRKRKLYTPEDGYKKFGIVSKDGVLVCFLRKGIEIDFKTMEEIKK